MEKDLKQLNRLLRKATDEKVKERLAALIDELDVDEEEVKEEVKEQVKEVEKVVEEKAKEEPAKQTQDFDIEEIREKLGLAKYEAIIVEQNKKLQEQDEALKKLQNRGYQSNVTVDDEAVSVDDIFANLNNARPKKL